MANSAYKRTVSSDDGIGFRFETKMTALAALRLYQRASEFHLANNFAKGDKFDDIVFTANIDGQVVTWFVQLKHKQISTLNDRKIGLSAMRTKDDFNLLKYFSSYVGIANKFQPSSKDVIFGKPFSSVKFALFTNARFNPVLFTSTPENHEFLLSTKSTLEQNIKFEKNDVHQIFSHMQCDGVLDDFLSKFYFCTGHINENDMDALLHSEIETINKELSKVEVKYVTHQLCDSIYNWVKSAKYLTKEDIGNILSRTSIDTQCGKRNECSLEFLPSIIKGLLPTYKNSKLVALKSKADSTIMCMTFFKQAGLTDEPSRLLSLQQLEKQDIREHLLHYWAIQPGASLVIDCEGDIMAIDKNNVAAYISLLNSQTKNSIFMLMTVGNEDAARIANLAKAKEYKFNCMLTNLADKSQCLLRERQVDFQGYKTKLSSLMPSGRNLEDVFNMELMTQLLLGRSVEVGVKPFDHIPYYVPRVLIRQASISSEILTELSVNARFALSGLTLEQAIMRFSQMATSSLQENPEARIIILEGDAEVEFTKLSELVKGNFYWFELKKGGKGSARLWQWRKSKYGSNMALINYHVTEDLDYLPTEDIMEVREKVVVITAEPGMGKSTLLEYLASETKKLRPHVWVICLALNDFTDHLDKQDFIKNIKVNAKNLITAAAGVGKETSKFDARLFNQCYDVTGNMIVLLDGFDEITPYYTEQGLALIDELKKSQISRVWITARPQWRDILEERTASLSYNIKSFSAKDQKNFLFKYWQHELPAFDSTKLKEFVNKVLDLVESSFDSKLHQFTGIPLQTRMIGEVFLDSVHSYHATDILTLKERLNGLELFREFVNKKRGIQMEKAKITVSNASIKFEQRKLNEQREKELMTLALLTLLQRNVCQTLDPPITKTMVHDLRQMVMQGNEKSGIVLSFKGEVPQFIHRTFAEYFAALFFTKHFSTNRNFLSSDNFFAGSFSFVKYFFDRILSAGNELHENVLDADIESISEKLKSNFDVDCKDEGGRTPLHVAASLPDGEAIIRLLLKNGANPKAQDNVLGWCPLQYACKIKAVENIGPLLEAVPGRLDPDSIPLTWQSLQMAVRGDYLQLLLHLIENGIYEVESLDELSPQMWMDDNVSAGLTILHIAAAFNASEILSYLLKKKSRDSKVRLLECVDHMGNTPLHLAGARRCGAAARVLVEAGANTLTKTSDGRNLFHYAVEGQDLDILRIAMKDAKDRNAPVEDFLPAAVTTLIGEKGERLDWANKALHIIFSVFPEVIHLKTTKGLPLIVAAVMKSNAFAVERLCDLGADVNLKTANGPLLHYAVRAGDQDIIGILLKSQSLDVNARDEAGHTALYKAVFDSQPVLVDMLLARGALLGDPEIVSEVLHCAVVNGQAELVKTLLDTKSINVNALDKEGHTPLYRAILNDNSAVSELLIDAGARVIGEEVNTVTDNGPLLHVAVVNGQEDMVMALIASTGLNVNLPDEGGYTALYKAAATGNPDIFERLRDAGADVNCVAKDGSDLTHAVALSQNKALFYYLLETGLDFKKPNLVGDTALSMLKAAGAEDLVKILDPNIVMAPQPTVTPVPKPTNARKKNKNNVCAENGAAVPANVVQSKPIPAPPNKKKAPQPNLPKKKARPPPVATNAPVAFTVDSFMDTLKEFGILSPSISTETLREKFNTMTLSSSVNSTGNQPAKRKKNKAKNTAPAGVTGQNIQSNGQQNENTPLISKGIGNHGGGPHLKINSPKPSQPPVQKPFPPKNAGNLTKASSPGPQANIQKKKNSVGENNKPPPIQNFGNNQELNKGKNPAPPPKAPKQNNNAQPNVPKKKQSVGENIQPNKGKNPGPPQKAPKQDNNPAAKTPQ